MDHKKELENLVETVLKEGASDLHISEGRHPAIRVGGFLVPLLKKAALSRADIDGMLKVLLLPDFLKRFMETKEVDFSSSFGEEARFRGNGFFQQGRISIALRLIPRKISTLAELNLPSSLEQFTRKQQGFFLVVGPVGHGKSTTLASMIEMINQSRAEHILTIEDPIEYVYEPKKSVIDQREVRIDTDDFKTINMQF